MVEWLWKPWRHPTTTTSNTTTKQEVRKRPAPSHARPSWQGRWQATAYRICEVGELQAGLAVLEPQNTLDAAVAKGDRISGLEARGGQQKQQVGQHLLAGGHEGGPAGSQTGKRLKISPGGQKLADSFYRAWRQKQLNHALTHQVHTQ